MLKNMCSQILPAHHERTQCCRRPSGGDSQHHLRFLRRAGRHRQTRRTQRTRQRRPDSVPGGDVSEIRSKLDRDHIRLPTLASRLDRFQEALVDHHAEPVTEVDRRFFTAIGACSQTRQYRRRTSASAPFFQETAQKAALWHERPDDGEEETACCSEATSDGLAQRDGRRGLFSRVTHRGSSFARQNGGCDPDLDISWRICASSFLPLRKHVGRIQVSLSG